MCLPCYLDDEADSHTCVLVSATECVDNIEILVAELLDSELLDLCPYILRHWVVVILVALCCPPYGVLRVLVHYNVLVLRRTAGVDTCHDVHSAKLSVLSYLETFETCLCLLLEQLLV